VPTPRYTRSFAAKREDGEIVMLHVFTEYQGPTEDTPGLKTIAMPDGTPVRRCGKGRYEVAGTLEILTTNDLSAP